MLFFLGNTGKTTLTIKIINVDLCRVVVVVSGSIRPRRAHNNGTIPLLVVMDGANLRFMYVACFYLVKGLLLIPPPAPSTGTRLNKCLTAGFDSFQFINRIRGVGRAQSRTSPTCWRRLLICQGPCRRVVADHKIMYHRRRSSCVVSRPTEDGGRMTRVASIFMLINI